MISLLKYLFKFIITLCIVITAVLVTIFVITMTVLISEGCIKVERIAGIKKGIKK